MNANGGFQLEGPSADSETGELHFTVRSDVRNVSFWVIPEEKEGERGWAVRIEGVPSPSIVHERPWRSVDDARDAAVDAVRAMLVLERVQREEEERIRAKTEAKDQEEDCAEGGAGV